MVPAVSLGLKNLSSSSAGKDSIMRNFGVGDQNPDPSDLYGDEQQEPNDDHSLTFVVLVVVGIAVLVFVWILH